MLRVPTLRHPDETSCLPTCVESVLQFLGYPATHEEVRRWCHTRPEGSEADLAVQGLGEAGFDAVLVQCTFLAELEERVLEEQPPIVVLAEGEGWYHCVVVCGVDPAALTVMDPRVGIYVEIPTDEFLTAWTPLSADTLLISGRKHPGV